MTRDLQTDKKAPSGVLRRERTPETVPTIVHEVLNSPGEPLDRETRQFFEPRFGHDFGQVRVHGDARAAESTRAVNARAYTVKNNIVLGAPGSSASKSVLAHELTHVVQQSLVSQSSLPVFHDRSETSEREAESTAATVMAGRVSSITPVHRQPCLQRLPADAELSSANLPLEEALRKIPGMPEEEALGVLKRFQSLIVNLIRNGEQRIRQIMELRAESISNYLIGGTIEAFGLTSLPSDSWEDAWKPVTDAYGTTAKRDVKGTHALLLNASNITRKHWMQLNEYLEATEKGADRSVFALQALEAAGAVAATALTGGGVAAIGVGAGYGATQNLVGQVTATTIGTSDRIDWGGLAFDTLFGVITGALGGKLGNVVLKRLMGNKATASLGRRVLSEVASDLVSGRLSSILQTAARSVFDKLRGRHDISMEQFIQQLADQLMDPKSMFLDAIMGRASKMAHAQKAKGPEKTGPVRESGATGKAELASPQEPVRSEKPHAVKSLAKERAVQETAVARPERPEASVSEKAGPAAKRPPAAGAGKAPGILELHPDFPGNVMVDSAISPRDFKKLMSHLEKTPQGEMIAQKIKSGEMHLTLTTEPIASGSGWAIGKEMQVTWAGSVEETVSTLVHEGTHLSEPELAKLGTPGGPSALVVEGSARAFEYEQRLQDGLPAYDLAEQDYRDTLDRVLKNTGDLRTARIEADKAMLQAMQKDPARYGVEGPAAPPKADDAAPAGPAAKPAPGPKGGSKPKSFEERAASTQKELADARKSTLEYFKEREAANESRKGGPIKGIHNAKEILWILNRQKAYPDRQILASCEIVGVREPNGKVTSTKKIAKTGREPDFIEIYGDKAVMGELKSEWELSRSLQGGPGTPEGGTTTVNPKTKLGKQWKTEDKVLARGTKVNGKIIISGYDVKTGEKVTVEVDPRRIERTLSSPDFGWGVSTEWSQ